MRAELLAKLLDQEIEVCREDAALAAAHAEVWRDNSLVYARFRSGRDGKTSAFRLECAEYDAQPPGVGMVDAESLDELPHERWTPGVSHGIHPSTGKPFVCLQGVAEYHIHPSHTDDSWDRYRSKYRLRETIKSLLRKAGAM